MNQDEIAALKRRLADQAERLVIALLGEPTARGQRTWRWGNPPTRCSLPAPTAEWFPTSSPPRTRGTYL